MDREVEFSLRVLRFVGSIGSSFSVLVKRIKSDGLILVLLKSAKSVFPDLIK
jgi:hypothetical protein